jgi:poly-gamma-glutamate synthesis protein (capsule biosynthesis protein)
MKKTEIILTALSMLIVLFTTNTSRGYAQQKVTLLAGGDVNWCLLTVRDGILHNYKLAPGATEGPYPKSPKKGIRLPFLNNPHNQDYLEKEYNLALESPLSHRNIAIHYHLSFNSDKKKEEYPLKKIAPVLRQADISLIDLETPLSDSARWVGSFRTPTSFAKALKWAGVDVATIANNHALDAGGVGLMNTIAALKHNSIGVAGGGDNLKDATKPVIIRRNGISIGILGYAQFVNEGRSAFALPARKPEEPTTKAYAIRPARSGVAPMDPFLIKKDIKALHGKVDYIVLALHGLAEDNQITYPAARKLYKQFIDDGADIIIGEHPHVPRGVEMYKGHPIIYCSGNFIFGHNHRYWGDNYLVRFVITKKKVEKVEILPIAGKGQDLSQPYLLRGKRAQKLLHTVQYLSKKMGTNMQISNNEGIIDLH